MLKKLRHATNAVGMGVMLSASTAFAEDSKLDLTLPQQDTLPTTFESYQWQNQPLLLASGDNTNQKSAFTPKEKNSEFTPPLFSGNKIHQYLGISTLALIALTAISPKEEDGPHEYAGTLAAATAAATVTSGLITHWEDFHLRDGLMEPDNLHMILGTVGAIAMAAAIAEAPESGHPTLGVAGGLAMGVAVKMTW